MPRDPRVTLPTAANEEEEEEEDTAAQPRPRRPSRRLPDYAIPDRAVRIDLNNNNMTVPALEVDNMVAATDDIASSQRGAARAHGRKQTASLNSSRREDDDVRRPSRFHGETVPKSSERRTSGSSRFFMNPIALWNGNSRVHPVAYSPDDAPQEEEENIIGGSESEILAAQRVQVEAAGELDPQLAVLAHMQRSLFVKTQRAVLDLFEDPRDSRVTRIVHRLIFTSILVNIAILAFETCDGYNHQSSAPGYPMLPDQSVYDGMDVIFAVIFSLELAGRVFARRCDRNVLSELTTWLDLMALAPSYIRFISYHGGGFDFDIDKLDGIAHYVMQLRLLRIVRLVTILRHYDESKILYLSIKSSIRPLSITMFFLFTLIMVLATALFYAEPCYNVTNCAFTDIFNTAYFIMVTIATVGYGNQVPSLKNVSSLLITCTAMIFGQLYFAMPLAIVGNNFQTTYDSFQSTKKRQLRRNDTTLIAFDSKKLHRKSQRLCEIQYQLIGTWRAVHSTIQKIIRVNRDKDAYNSLEVIQAQLKRMELIKDTMDSLLVAHMEATKALEVFLPHKKRTQGGISNGKNDGMFQNMYTRARRAMNRAAQMQDTALPSARHLSESLKGKLWLMLEVPDSSRVAGAINKFMVSFALFSILLFCFESLPELHSAGPETAACRRVVEEYCSKYGFANATQDAGCYRKFVENRTSDFNTPLNFDCLSPTEDSACYGYGFNFGNNASSCEDAFLEAGVDLICFRQQCTLSPPTIDMEPYWIYFEWFLGISFTLELVLRLIATPQRRKFLSDFYNMVDALTVVPFFVEVMQYIVYGVEPSYAIVATSPSFLSLIRILKTMRILKLTRHFRGTKVLASTAKECWRQLTIPLFFLFTSCILAGAIFYEVERGTECFVGQECEWWNKNVLTPSLAKGYPPGKRILIQDSRPAIIIDMVHSTWLSFATFTTVGYGDMRPRTPIGRLFCISVMIFGTIYCAMPLALVGGKFYSLYEKHMAKMVMRRGGSSASWRARRKLTGRMSKATSMLDDDDDDDDQQSRPARPFNLSDEELERIHTFMGMRRTLQNLQRTLENLFHVGQDIRQQQQQKNAGDKNLPPLIRNTENLELNIERKSNAIMDAILLFSELVEKLQDAPPQYEAVMVDDRTSTHAHSEAISVPPLRDLATSVADH